MDCKIPCIIFLRDDPSFSISSAHLAMSVLGKSNESTLRTAMAGSGSGNNVLVWARRAVTSWSVRGA